MADDADKSSLNQEILENARIENTRLQAAKFVPGVAGECDKCGEYYLRIVNGYCARCRDLLKLP